MMPRSRSRRGFTLIEILVTMAIVGVLIALLLVGVQAARSAALRVDCANRMRQIGLAMANFHTAQNCLPSNGGWDGSQTIQSKQGFAMYVSAQEVNKPAPYYYGVGDPSRRPTDQTGSWAYAILPFLEQSALYNGGNQTWETMIAAYTCPARRSPTALPCPPSDRYCVSYSSGGWNWGRTDYAANNWVIPNRPVCLNYSNFRDGLTTTMVVGEKSLDPTLIPTGTWFWDEPFFVGGAGGTARGESEVFRDVPGVKFQQNWGSAHPSGAQFLFGDGSVRLVKYGTSPDLVRTLRTPDGAEVISDAGGL